MEAGQARAPLSGLLTGEQNRWRGIRLVNAYRILVALALVVAAMTRIGPDSLGQWNPDLFGLTAWAYLGAALAFEFLLELRVLPFRLQMHLYALADIGFLLMLLYATGEPVGGVLGLLLVVAVAMAANLGHSRTALFYAAVAAIGGLIQTTVLIIQGVLDSGDYTATGALGMALFTVAGLVSSLTRRAEGLEALSAQREAEIARMARLSLRILEQFEDGVVVADRAGRVQYVNSAARGLLADSAAPDGHYPLIRALARERTQEPTGQVEEVEQPRPMQIRIRSLDEQNVLLLLVDRRRLEERAQEVKLAALGRLTASIAHEIRNPLSSIQHAAELLEEQVDQPQARRLTGILVRQSQRIDTLIRGVLDAARQPRVQRQPVRLDSWLRQYADLHEGLWSTQAVTWRVHLPSEAVWVLVDASHLAQVVDNLVRNAMEHGRDDRGHLVLDLSVQRVKDGRIQLRVADEGAGIAGTQRDQLWEPFFTTSAAGTGLGLYISRELVQANQGELNLVAGPRGGSCFVITLPAASEPPREDRESSDA
ncbi:MAG: sensor histidine kinase [Halothiobacillaceae bacterium]